MPALFLALYLALYPKNYQFVILSGAYCALALLIGILLLNPLISAFPKKKWIKTIKKINKYRQEIGVSCFIYALIHASGFVVKRGGIMKTIPWIVHPVVFLGVLSLMMLSVLAITSNRFSMRKLGPRWKTLHKKVYIVQWLVLAHMLFVGTIKNYIIAFAFVPLIILQLARQRKIKFS
ncbi:MAG TPA: hypothetical protein DIU37_03570 [Opitutae bacterium]|nr:hypothetical protein [Opitutae bacterium]|tara:strand:- start:544 stop:1077 length:534 start_codon:yes stop_codon:yes gene_type:complete